MHPCTNTSKPITVTDAMVYIYVKKGCYPHRLSDAFMFFKNNSKDWCFSAEENAFREEVYEKESEDDFKNFLDRLLTDNLVNPIPLANLPPFSITEEEYMYLNELKRSYQNDAKGLYRHCKLALFLQRNYHTEILTYDTRAIPIIQSLGLSISNHLKHLLSQLTGLP